MSFKEQLEHKNIVKAKKPHFRRTDAHKKIRLEEVWRRPKGYQNKMRLRKRGYARHLEVGWGSPKGVRFLNKTGLLPVHVENQKQVSKLDPKKHALILASSTGAKMRIALIELALKNKFFIQNLADPQKYLETMKQSLKDRKDVKVKRKENRTTKREATRKEGEKAAKKNEEEKTHEKTEEERAEEKKEYDKRLISE